MKKKKNKVQELRSVYWYNNLGEMFGITSHYLLKENIYTCSTIKKLKKNTSCIQYNCLIIVIYIIIKYYNYTSLLIHSFL